MQSQKNTRCNALKFVNRLSAAFFSTSLLVLATASVELQSAGAVESEAGAQRQSPSQRQATVTPTTPLPDGVYLYGQSPKPNEIGKGYFVFESKQGKVIGALYMPSSSFDCATGTFKENQLALSVTNSYERTTNPFEIALQRSTTVATNSNPTVGGIGLEGFHKISTVSQNDLRILNTCKADFAGQAKK